MARLARLHIPGCPQHVIQRGNARGAVFLDDADRIAYLDWLAEVVRDFRLELLAYVLMDNHTHLLAIPPGEGVLGRALQSLGRRYVRYFNDRHGLAGTIWEGRYRSTIIDSERYLIECMRYIDLNPVRAGLVVDPGAYRWSSYAHHAGIADLPMLTDPPLYWALGNTPFARQAVYRELCAEGMSADVAQRISDATNKGWALGDDAFLSRIGQTANRRPQPVLTRGRPPIKPINFVPINK
jgi:putative transposase